jgi:O-antigen ligase
MTALPVTHWVERARLARLADGLAMATVASLPWSTSAASIFIVLWLLALLPTLDVKAVSPDVLTAAGGIPVLLWLLGIAGLMWAADVSWRERLGGIESFHRLLVVPLAFAQFRRSEQGIAVAIVFLLSESVLLAFSFVHYALWDFRPFHFGYFAGVPVKHLISQSAMFEVCCFGLLGLVAAEWEAGRRRQALGLLVLAAAFLLHILYIATARTALVGLPVLAILFGFRYFGWKGVLVALATGVLIAAISWASSPYLRWRVDRAVEEVQIYLTTGKPTSSGVRLEWWRKAAGFIEQAPILGHGTGSINEMYRRSQTHDDSAASIKAENPHQQLLAVAIQLGLVGAAVLIAMWAAHVALFWIPGPVGWAGLVVVVQQLVGSLFNSSLFDFTEGWLYVLGVGVLGGIVRRQQFEKRPVAASPAAVKPVL